MPDDDQDGAADRDDSFLRAASAGDPPVAFTEEGVGSGRADGGLAQDAGQVAVAMPGRPTALLLARGLLDPGRELGPRSQMVRSREPAHVQADLRDDDRSGGPAN